MTEPMPHPGDEIQDLLDGRLDPAREAVVREHLAACETCRQEWERLQWLKARLRALSETASVPADLDAQIRAALDRAHGERLPELPELRTPVDASTPSLVAPRNRVRRIRRMGWAIAASIAAILAIASVAGFWWFRPPTPAEIAADFRAIDDGRLPVEFATPEPSALQRHFVSRGGVPTGVYDLAPMNYVLVGGRAHAHRRQPATIAVYRGPRGELLICEMFFAAPPSHSPIERRSHNGIEFTVYRQGDVVVVFWDEGPVTCVLASVMDPEALLQLAFAKAGRPS